VRAYSRTISQAFGRDISPTRIDIQAYSRVANLDAQLYLRAGLGGMESRATTELAAVMDQKIAE
jgi:hypothetical protein